jgi:hypothetical protein
MADDDGIGGMIGALFMFVLVVTAVVLAVMALMSVGAVYGAGAALRNYGLAFANNIKPERATT